MMIKTDKQRRLALDRDALSRRFPNCFSSVQSTHKLPLKVGIINDLLDAEIIGEDGQRLDCCRIKDAVRDYCTGPKYQLGILRNKTRVDLAGRPAGVITEVERKHAEMEISRYSQRWQDKAKFARVRDSEAYAGDGGTVFREVA